MASIRKTLTYAQHMLQSALAIEDREARIEARILLRHILKTDHARLIAHESDALEANNHADFEALLQRRLKGEPIAYILGYREFYGLNLNVTPATLIPRPDTETLVEAALVKIPLDTALSILDLGTGSGAIALAIASQRPNVEMLAVDASDAALAVAKLNAEVLDITNVRFLQSDWFATLDKDPNGKFDLIVSNPPYIAAEDMHLTQGDLRFEPLSALASGKDGLDDIRRIIHMAPSYLKPHGWLMLEHGFDQVRPVSVLLAQQGFTEITYAQDLAGIARVSMGRWTAAGL